MVGEGQGQGKGQGQARLGFRPQDLTLDPKGQISGEVTLIERLGTETVVELATADHITLRYALVEEVSFALGDTIKLKIDPAKAHVSC